MSKIYYVNTSFEATSLNPFDNNKPYNNNWIMLKLVKDADFFIFTGNKRTNLFRVIISKQCEGWQYRIMDFIEYEMTHNKNIIISVNVDDLNEAKTMYKGHNFKDKKLRYYEPKVLVHSTPLYCYESIKISNCLKSWNLLKKHNLITEEKPIGSILGDPYDYSDYVMLASGVTCEIVVASKQKNKIDMNEDASYEPGARLYFNVEKIAEDGLLIRDGAHYKVKDKLPLDKYLLWSATVENVCPENEINTPGDYACLCDKMFEENFVMPLK